VGDPCSTARPCCSSSCKNATNYALDCAGGDTNCVCANSG
jgi:hypothetical protein